LLVDRDTVSGRTSDDTGANLCGHRREYGSDHLPINPNGCISITSPDPALNLVAIIRWRIGLRGVFWFALGRLDPGALEIGVE
jgi:hypothetical protein